MKKIGIIGAMEIEVEKLKAEMENCSMCRKAGMEFFEGTLDGADVVVVNEGKRFQETVREIARIVS